MTLLSCERLHRARAGEQMDAPGPVGDRPAGRPRRSRQGRERSWFTTATATGMVPMPNFEFWDVSAQRLL